MRVARISRGSAGDADARERERERKGEREGEREQSGSGSGLVAGHFDAEDGAADQELVAVEQALLAADAHEDAGA